MPRYECYQCHRTDEATTPAQIIAADNGVRCLCPQCHERAIVWANIHHVPPDHVPTPYRAGRTPAALETQQRLREMRDGRVIRKSDPMS